eukprot:TRINITY_DN29827_c0_g1_i1.p1 TRINITY_DN29827_c0_g1~~TRINITY_DN29827_c0_g1_i1.p1  ORF type:complete len:402 (-),score=59.26 TRINITY_DN29827_c0_g1_i1:96-1301(-)
MSCASPCRSQQEILEGEPPRFQVGDSVACKTGRTKWQDGEIVQLWWRHPGNRIFYPYQVQLRSDKRLIYVPVDDDDIIRKIERTWWEFLREQHDFSDEEFMERIDKLSKGRNLDARTHDGETALLWALKSRLPAVVSMLLRRKADPNCEGQNCERALNVVVSRYSGAALTDFTKALLAAKSNSQLQDKDSSKDPDYGSKSFKEPEWHRTALHYAAEQGHTQIMAFLLEARALLDKQDAQYKMPLHLAIESQNMNAINWLIDSKADMNTGHIEVGLATSPLIDAAYRNDQDLIHVLINAKANLDHRGKQDMTALHVAARGRHAGAVRILVEAGADITLRAGGKTAGWIAFKNGLSETARLLGYTEEHSTVTGDSILPSPLLDAKTRTMLFLDEPPPKYPRAS